jgi:hypothetical protein
LWQARGQLEAEIDPRGLQGLAADEFCTKRPLQNQTGHAVDDWLLVAQELTDNALDAEEAEVAPAPIAVKPGDMASWDACVRLPGPLLQDKSLRLGW